MRDDVKAACKGDEDRITEILDEQIANPEARQAKRADLLTRVRTFVNQHWQTIEAVAETLWAKAWTPTRPHHASPSEKAMSAVDLKPIITSVPVAVDEKDE